MAIHLITYGVLVILLVIAMITDVRARVLPNWLTGLIALTAPLSWILADLSMWPDVAVRLSISFVCLMAFAVLHWKDLMGGGDVKLIAALALWLTPALVIPFLLLMSVLGGILSLGLWLWEKRRPLGRPIEVPYGVAIAGAGFWAIVQMVPPFILI